jgi:uncharacterized DUF497 family protein
MTSYQLGTLCLKQVKESNYSSWQSITEQTEACPSHLELRTFKAIEWDEEKNQINIKKHKISFERAHEILSDPANPRIIAEKKEKIDIEDFKKKGIPLNEGNLDPYRDEILGLIDGKVHVLVTTFRHSFEQMKYRVISLRRADDKAELFYLFRPDLRK